MATRIDGNIVGGVVGGGGVGVPAITAPTDVIIYRDWTTGSDANAGTLAAPVKTWNGAVARIPQTWQGKCRIRLVPGAVNSGAGLDVLSDTALASPPGHPVGPNAQPLCFDGAPQDGGGIPAMTVLASLSVTSTTTLPPVWTVTGGGLTVDAYAGKWLRVKSNALAGQVFQADFNDATTITLVGPGPSVALAGGTTFDVVTAPTIIDVANPKIEGDQDVAFFGVVFRHQATNQSLTVGYGVRVALACCEWNGVGGASNLAVRDGGWLSCTGFKNIANAPFTRLVDVGYQVMDGNGQVQTGLYIHDGSTVVGLAVFGGQLGGGNGVTITLKNASANINNSAPSPSFQFGVTGGRVVVAQDGGTVSFAALSVRTPPAGQPCLTVSRMYFCILGSQDTPGLVRLSGSTTDSVRIVEGACKALGVTLTGPGAAGVGFKVNTGGKLELRTTGGSIVIAGHLGDCQIGGNAATSTIAQVLAGADDFAAGTKQYCVGMGV